VAEHETRLVLIRHGQAQAATEGIVAGHAACSGLSELGRRQAQALHDRLAASGELRADVLYTSVLPRAIETAEIVAPALGPAQLERDCDFCELHVGEADGMSWDEYWKIYGFSMRAEPERPISPGGESLVSFQGRVETRLEKLLADHAGRTVVVVCHGGVISAASHRFMGSSLDRGVARFEPANTSITEWVHRPEAEVHWLLARFNDASHAHGLAPDA
jgi:probable phosphoglycerate mutase